ncbi:2-dehydropantoate 2-reductase [Bombilactobacillus mellis]|uniref:2-dehydropantoate 2-reductase n=1 Tax=Bombilactobacillus mellis TaxID=1218508 RepID=UPI002246AC6F|nr:2-dehydropantoate 2-reductase [Bombilactobacillus mellis]MCX0279641.1 2-dehydropantoate 2-reductase [Bombilactobacillus mellis]
MKIAIVGVGAMGSRFALMLHKSGNDLVLIDGWQPNVQAIRQQGLQADFNGKAVTANIPVYSLEEVDQLQGYQPELIIAFTKSYQLDSAFAKIKALITPQTYVLCLLNGMGHESILKKYVDDNHLLLGITMWTAGLAGPGHATLFGNGNVELKNFGSEGKDFALKVVDVFNDAGLCPKYIDDPKYAIWRKACVNGTLNTLCSILDCNIGELGQTQEATDFLKTIIAEFAAVAAQEGVNLDQAEVYQHVDETFHGDIADHYPSMYQDLLKNHRKTEIDFINGAVWQKGKEYGVATPYCTLITQLIHAKEELLGV